MLSTSPRSILALFALTVAVQAAVGSPGADMRIRLLEQLEPTAVVVTTRSSEISVATVDGPLFTLPAMTRVQVTMRGGDVFLDADGRTVRASQLLLTPVSDDALTIELRGTSARHYAGSLQIAVDEGRELKLINHVPLEAYVASVVAGEYGLDDLEGSKAMAVIARTYALKALKSGDGSYDHVDHTLSQVYRGAGAVTPLASEAARLTAGQVLTHNGNLIEAVYFSSSGGHTADNETVWQSSPHPYLRGREDAWDQISPHHTWTFELSRDELHNMIRDAYGLEVQRIEVAERSADGRAASIALVPESGRTRTLSANELRLEISRRYGVRSMRSTLFDLTATRSRYRFDGHGFGHGVGLSQWGAHAMALAGHSYDEILDYYYTDVALQGGDTPAVRYAARSEPPPAPPTPGHQSETASAQSPSTSSPAAPNPTPRRRLGW